MSLKIVVINGAATHGKDTFVKYVKKHFLGEVVSHSTVETVKKAAKLFGADATKCKGDAERRLWSDMKDAWTRYCDGPFKEIVERADQIEKVLDPEHEALFFVHVREPEEIWKLVKHFKRRCTTVLVKAGGGHIPDNHADQNVENFPYDIYVDNCGTIDELGEKARRFVAMIDWD